MPYFTNRGIVALSSIQTIYDQGTLENDIGNLGAAYTFRNVIPVTGGNLGRVRVTFKNSSSGNFIVDHASVAVADLTRTSIGQADALSVPNELLFSGVSGFTIASGNSIVSDWVATTDNFTSSDSLIVVFDMNASGAYIANHAGTALVRFARFQSAVTSYNQKLETAAPDTNNSTYCIVKIETGP